MYKVIFDLARVNLWLPLTSRSCGKCGGSGGCGACSYSVDNVNVGASAVVEIASLALMVSAVAMVAKGIGRGTPLAWAAWLGAD